MSIHERMERIKRAQEEAVVAAGPGVAAPEAPGEAPAGTPGGPAPAPAILDTAAAPPPAAEGGATATAVTPPAAASDGVRLREAPLGAATDPAAATDVDQVPVAGPDTLPVSATVPAAGSPSAPGSAAPAPSAPADPPAVRPAPPPVARPVRTTIRDDRLREVRVALRAEAAKASASLARSGGADLRDRIEIIVDRVVGTSRFAVTRDERQRLIEDMLAEIQGLGPIEPYLKDDTITEVMVNGAGHIYIERRGKIERTDAVFLNDEHVLQVIDRIVTPIGRRIDQSSPRVDARLKDGSRVNVIIEPLSLVGPVITIRKFSKRPYTVDDLVGFGTATAEMFDFLRACVEARLNIFVSGGTGSGKTTTLNVLSSFIPNDERIITIEDAAELQLNQTHVVTLEARPVNLEGKGEITIRDLLVNALHMRPDRIIVGECRGGEALDMIQAMSVGHEGSLSTGHANTPEDMLRRIETMVLMSGVDLPLRTIREQIAAAVDLVVHTARLKDGSRKVINITEVYGIEDDVILTNDVFRFEQTALREGKVEGELVPTGYRPTFMSRFTASGVTLPPGDFGIPSVARRRRTAARLGKGRWVVEDDDVQTGDLANAVGAGRTVRAGGMLYISGVGPIDRSTGIVIPGAIREQTRQGLQNLKAILEAQGSSLDRVVWANWSLREASDYDDFMEEWNRWFPDGAAIGQETLMPPVQRRAGFRVCFGVIAQEQAAAQAGAGDEPSADARSAR